VVATNLRPLRVDIAAAVAKQMATASVEQQVPPITVFVDTHIVVRDLPKQMLKVELAARRVYGLRHISATDAASAQATFILCAEFRVDFLGGHLWGSADFDGDRERARHTMGVAVKSSL